MAFEDSYNHYRGKYQQLHRDRADIAQKIRAHLGLVRVVSVYSIRFEVWSSVVWVAIPGQRPRFVSRKALEI